MKTSVNPTVASYLNVYTTKYLFIYICIATQRNTSFKVVVLIHFRGWEISDYVT